MLQKIRDRIQGWFAIVIIVIIAAAFMLFGVEYYIGRSGNDSKTVATVDGTKITEQQLKETYRGLERKEIRARHGAPLSEQTQQQLKQIALQEIVTNTALINAATDAGFRVSLAQVKQLIMQAPEFQAGGRFSPRRFQQLMQANQMTESQFLGHIRGTLLTNQVTFGIESSEFVLPEELAASYRLIYQKRNFGYFILPGSKFRSGVTVSKQDIENYYKQHTDQYKTPEKVKVSYLLLSSKSLEKNIQISPAKVQAYYQSNKASYKVSKRWKIARITIPLPTGANQQKIAVAEKQMKKIEAQLAKGMSFTTLMKQAGAQKATTEWVNENQASTNLSNVLSTLQLKQVSKPFHTTNGINIVRLLAKKPAKTKSFDEVKAKIKRALLQQQAEQLLSKENDQLSNLTYTNPTTLKVAAKVLDVAVQTSPLITRQGKKSGLFSNSAVLAAAFSGEVLQDGNNSNPIVLKDGSVIVLRVSKHVPSSVQVLSSVRASIKQRLLRQKAEAKAGLEAYQIESALGSDASPQTLAKKYNLKWVIKRQVLRKDKTISSPILAAAFSTVPAKDKKLSGVDSLLLVNGDYIVIKVFSYKNADYSKASTKIRQRLSSELTNLWGQINYKFYAKAAINRAKIKTKKASS